MSALAPVWSTDIKSAPHGRYEIKQRREGVDIRVFVPERVILATKCGKVTISHYQPEVKRWEMLADGEMPVAWSHHHPGQKLPEYPEHHSQAKASEDNGGTSAFGSAPTTGEASRASVGAGTDAFNSPPLAHETRGGTGDDCSVGKRGVWPPQGGASSSRALNGIGAEQVVTGGESAAINPQSDGDAFAAVTVIDQLANANSVEPSPSDIHSSKLISSEALTDSPAGVPPSPSLSGTNHESDGPKSRPGDAAASLTQQSNSPRQERPSAQERSSDRSGGQFGDAPKPAQIQCADAGADITMTHEGIRT